MLTNFLSRIMLLWLILGTFGCCAFLDWIFVTPDEPSNLKTASNSPLTTDSADIAVIKAPFEMQTAEEKFLEEAKKFTEIQLSDLDVCQHKLILQLRGSCSTLSEDDISKLSVNLLNCQSAVEGRAVFPCSDEMTIRECTKDMDPNTWNAYLIISNRARAVCYALRQQHFKATAEITVNKLMSTAEQQLAALLTLRKGQEELGEMTQTTFETVSQGQQQIFQQQEKLKHAQRSIHGFMSSNLRELMKEKTLISAGQKELVLMAESIQQKLDIAHKNLATQKEEREKDHQAVMTDLSVLQQKAELVWKKLDESIQHIVDQQSFALTQYKTALENLHRINDSINYLLKLVEDTRTEVDHKLSWLTSIAGGTGDQLAVISTCLLHLVYFLLAALGAVFLQAPSVTRIAILIIIPLNAISEVRYSYSLSFVAVVNFVTVITVGLWAVKKLLKYMKKIHYPSAICFHQFKIPSLSFINRPTLVNGVQHTIDNSIVNNITNDSSETDTEEQDEDIDEDEINETSAIPFNTSSYSNGPARNIESSLIYSPVKESFTPISRKNPYSPLDAEVNNVRRSLLDSLDENSSSYHLRSTPSRNSVTPSRSSTPLRNISTNSPKACLGVSRKGQQCRLNRVPGEFFCRLHLKK